jgi:serine/threonine protein kinase/Leucine-rich repeat (LRR) protein
MNMENEEEPVPGVGGTSGEDIRHLLELGLDETMGEDAPPDAEKIVPRITRIGDYEVIEELGRGGMGVVYKARQCSLNRIVAIKMILAANFASKVQQLRFFREAELIASLRHPNIVAIYEIGEYEGQPFYSMDFIEGKSLKDMIKVNALAWSEAARFAKVIAEAMQVAHDHGVIHRDLKPQNILVDHLRNLHVADFGLARDLNSDQGLTMTGAVIGTPNYMSPEQSSGSGEMVPATDVFAIGAVLYEMLTALMPFRGGSVSEVLENVRSYDPIAPRRINPSIPKDLNTVCLKCLQKEPGHRYQTAKELAEDLDRVLRDIPIRAKPISATERGWRWCKRNRALASVIGGTTAIIVLGTVTAFVVLNGEKNQATEALSNLRGTAPTFYDQARALVDEQKFEDALVKINYAISLVPEEPEYHNLKGNILQTLLRLPEAAQEYRQVVATKPDYPWARQNLDLCETILRENAGQTRLNPQSLAELTEALSRQGRSAEALKLAPQSGLEQKYRYDEAFAKLKAALKFSVAETKQYEARLNMDNNSQFSLDLSNLPVSDLAPFQGMALESLNLSFCSGVSDLGPLKGMLLKELRIRNTGVSDLSPLHGMALSVLEITSTKVSDLGPLMGIPLKELRMHGAGTSDLSPLHGMPLSNLDISGTKVSDLSPLHGTALSDLDISGTKVSDLSPLRGMPLNKLVAYGSPISDLSALAGMPLAYLDLHSDGNITEITPLTGMPLKEIVLAGCLKLSDFRPLAGLPLERLILCGTGFDDTNLLKGMPLKTLDLYETNVRDVTALGGLSQLEVLVIPKGSQNIEALRGLPNLKRLSFATRYWVPPGGGGYDDITPVADFWKAYDAQKQGVH